MYFTKINSNSKYILFLKESKKIDGYWVNALYQGKVNLNETDEKELDTIRAEIALKRAIARIRVVEKSI